jgi:hypothetical protein
LQSKKKQQQQTWLDTTRQKITNNRHLTVLKNEKLSIQKDLVRKQNKTTKGCQTWIHMGDNIHFTVM